jgi:major membrane immunogen (membrane-anchored lipoprotein)
MSDKALNNTSVEDLKKTTSDVEVFGDGNLFQLLSKASSKSQGWMKSTKAMEAGNGCVVQVTTEFRDKQGNVTAVAEALTYVPNAIIWTYADGTKYLIDRGTSPSFVMD